MAIHIKNLKVRPKKGLHSPKYLDLLH